MQIKKMNRHSRVPIKVYGETEQSVVAKVLLLDVTTLLITKGGKLLARTRATGSLGLAP